VGSKSALSYAGDHSCLWSIQFLIAPTLFRRSTVVRFLCLFLEFLLEFLVQPMYLLYQV
jgi:hypothetical protein